MSCGLVICSKCKRETEQSGPRSESNGWRHADDGTVLCAGAESRYPQPGEGQCEARNASGVRCINVGTHWHPGREPWQTQWKCDGHHLTAPLHVQIATRGGAGNDRNAPCRCGSGKKFKKCCRLSEPA